MHRLDLRGRAVVALTPGLAIGGDRREPPPRNLRVARERLRFRAHLGKACALAFDRGPCSGQLRFDIGSRGQCLERALRVVTRSRGFLAARGQPCLGFAQCRDARRVTARLAFGFGMSIARSLRLLLQRAPARAGGGLRLGGARDLGLGRRDRLFFALDLAAHGFDFSLDLGEAVLAGEPARGAGRCIGGNRETVPTPEVAFARDQSLTGFEQRDEALSLVARDHADLREAPCQLLGRLDALGERFDALR